MKLRSITNKIVSLCVPAQFYLAISALSIILIVSQNLNGQKNYCLGQFKAPCNNKASAFAMKILYIIIWTFILDYLCRKGYSKVSWLLVLFPFIMMFVLIGAFMLMAIRG
jgi:hypothetical protein